MNKSSITTTTTALIAFVVAIITIALFNNVHAVVAITSSSSQLRGGNNSSNNNNNKRRNLKPVTHMEECILFKKDIQFEDGSGEECWSCEMKMENGAEDSSAAADGSSSSQQQRTTTTTEMVDITGLTTETIDKMSNAISGESILKIPSQANAYIVLEELQSSSGYRSQKHLYIPEESVSIIEIEILDINDYRHADNRRKRRRARQRLLTESESSGQQGQHRNLASSTGELVTLVVRGIDGEGTMNTASDAQLSEDVFTDRVCLATQYAACSHNQLIITPATGEGVGIVNGIVNVTVSTYNVTTNNVGKNAFQTEIEKATKIKLGTEKLYLEYDLVLYCLPPGLSPNSNGKSTWVAYAYINDYRSYYNDHWCQRVSAQLHEVGHNLNLAHSGIGANQYEDKSGMMGYSYNNDDLPEQCFNAAKNYQLGWYNLQKASYSPLDNIGSSQEFILNGINEYDKINGSPNDALITLRLECGIENGCTTNNEDYYIGYNAGTGPNVGTIAAKNMITILEKDNFASAITKEQREYTYGKSRRIAILNPTSNIPSELSYTIEQYGGTQFSVTIDILSISGNQNQDITIRVTTSDESPTSSPTQSCSDSDGGRFKLQLLTDVYGSETSWSIQNTRSVGTNDGYVYQSPTGLVQNKLYIYPDYDNDSYCLQKEECYVFKINDTWGDGICCGQGVGYYKGLLDGVEIFTGGDFGSSETQKFCYTPAEEVVPTESPVIVVVVPPTEAPVVPPTEAPVVPPTDAPVAPPTEAPTVPPTEAPVVPPTEAPVVPPTEAPVVPPTEAPVAPLIEAPVVPPIEAPVAPLIEAPVVPPTEAPVVSPTEAPVALSCVDGILAFNGKNKRNCQKWVSKKQNKIVKKCKRKTKNDDGTKTKVFDICRKTCGKVGLGPCKNEF